MKALISPNELVYKYDGTVLGSRVAQISDEFDVAPPLFWVDCADEIVPDQYYYADDLVQIIPTKPAVVQPVVEPVVEPVVVANTDPVVETSNTEPQV